MVMVIMVSGIVRGHMRMTAMVTTESRKMAAILQIIGWQIHAALVTVYLIKNKMQTAVISILNFHILIKT